MCICGDSHLNMCVYAYLASVEYIFGLCSIMNALLNFRVLSAEESACPLLQGYLDGAGVHQASNMKEKNIVAKCGVFDNGRAFYTVGSQTTPNFRERFRVSPRTILNISQSWIPKPHFWYPLLRLGSQPLMPKHLCFLASWRYTDDFGFSACIFPAVPVTKLGSQHQCIKTLSSFEGSRSARTQFRVRFLAVKIPSFLWVLALDPNPEGLRALARGIPLSKYDLEWF